MNLHALSQLPAPTMAARTVTIIIAIVWLAVGLWEVISPIGWDVKFGVPLKGHDGLSFVQAVGARNFVISLLVIFASVTGMRATLAALMASIAIMAAIDFYIVSSAVSMVHALKHALFVVIMTSISIWVAFS